MISIKIHHSYRKVVAVCDSEIIGKKFEENNKQLDLRERFFKDKEFTKQEAISIMKKYAKEDATFNIVGKESISAAIEANIINKKCVMRVKNIPFALSLL
ncbi:MAG: DUF424 family protein [Candidatus Pacearchaeota archaeon]|nr:DUF424 family protein [Candidatus Pacearchaeota archaeon]